MPETLREQTLLCEGPRLFNVLPDGHRDISVSKETFKRRLDVFLQSIPVQPRLSFLEPSPMGSHGRHSNSLRDWVKYLGLNNWISGHSSEEDVHITS